MERRIDMEYSMRSHATNVPKGDAFYVLCQVRMCDGAAGSGSGSGSGSGGAPVGDDAGNVDDKNSRSNRVRVVMHFTPVFVQSTWFASLSGSSSTPAAARCSSSHSPS